NKKILFGSRADIPGGEPIAVVGEQQPAEGVVIAVDFRLEATRAVQAPGHAAARLRPAIEAGLATGTMGAVGRPIGIKQVTGVAVRVVEVIAAAEIIRPDVSVLRSD